MKAVILNSGTGSRMGELTARQPKCLVALTEARAGNGSQQNNGDHARQGTP